MNAVMNGMPVHILFIAVCLRACMNLKVRGNSVPLLVPRLYLGTLEPTTMDHLEILVFGHVQTACPV